MLTVSGLYGTNWHSGLTLRLHQQTLITSPLYYVNSIILISNHDHHVKYMSLSLQPLFFTIGAERSAPNAYTADRLVCRVLFPSSPVAHGRGKCLKAKMDAKDSIL